MKKMVVSFSMFFLILTGVFTACKAPSPTNEGASEMSTSENSKEITAESTAASSTWSNIEKTGKIKIGLCPEYPPFESVNAEGKMEGFDIDLATVIAKEMGLEVEFMNTPWEGLISGLNNGEFDLIMSAMSPEEATAATDAVAMSEAYYRLNDVIAVKSDNNDIETKKDLAGKVVGFQTGSAAEQSIAVLKKDGIAPKTENPYNRNSDAFTELANGRIDAVVVSYPYAVTQSKEDHSFKVVNDAIQGSALVAIAIKGADDLIEKYNEALKKVKSDGRYQEIEKQWLSVEK